MPAAARAHTKAGAKAFVEYFWDVVNYAQATGDTGLIRTLSIRGCQVCEDGIAGVGRTYRRGGRIRGGEAHVSGLHADLLLAGEVHLAHVTYAVRVAQQQNDLPGTANDSVEPGYRSRDRLVLIEGGQGWLVSDLTVVR